MARIAIVGAGRVGTAVAKILLTLSDSEVSLIDASETALAAAYEACSNLPRPDYQVALAPVIQLETYVAADEEQLEATLRGIMPEIIVCSTPFNVNIVVARIASELPAHYIDFTEDNGVTAAITALNIKDVTFVPQTGLAPGLVNYIGLSLFEDLGEPLRLELRVGALPQVSWGPGHYAITWSPEGLINEYLKPTFRKVHGSFETLGALDEHEELIVDGTRYEAFTTAGGVGSVEAYEHIPSVQYKTIRYPGHLAFLQKMLAKVDNDFDLAVKLARQTFESTRDDVVVLVAHAVDKSGMSASAGLHFYPSNELQLTALELTTAGLGVGIIELLLAGKLEKGVLNCAQIPFEDLMNTGAVRLVFDHLA